MTSAMLDPMKRTERWTTARGVRTMASAQPRTAESMTIDLDVVDDSILLSDFTAESLGLVKSKPDVESDLSTVPPHHRYPYADVAAALRGLRWWPVP